MRGLWGFALCAAVATGQQSLPFDSNWAYVGTAVNHASQDQTSVALTQATTNQGGAVWRTAQYKVSTCASGFSAHRARRRPLQWPHPLPGPRSPKGTSLARSLARAAWTVTFDFKITASSATPGDGFCFVLQVGAQRVVVRADHVSAGGPTCLSAHRRHCRRCFHRTCCHCRRRPPALAAAPTMRAASAPSSPSASTRTGALPVGDASAHPLGARPAPLLVDWWWSLMRGLPASPPACLVMPWPCPALPCSDTSPNRYTTNAFTSAPPQYTSSNDISHDFNSDPPIGGTANMAISYSGTTVSWSITFNGVTRSL